MAISNCLFSPTSVAETRNEIIHTLCVMQKNLAEIKI